MKNANYDFFRWEKELRKINVSCQWKESQGKLLKKKKDIIELEAKKKILDKKVKKLKIEKNNMEKAMQDMSNKLCQLYVAVFKYARGEKYGVLAVVMS